MEYDTRLMVFSDGAWDGDQEEDGDDDSNNNAVVGGDDAGGKALGTADGNDVDRLMDGALLL